MRNLLNHYIVLLGANIELWMALYRLKRKLLHIWIMDRLYWLVYGEKLWLHDKDNEGLK